MPCYSPPPPPETLKKRNTRAAYFRTTPIRGGTTPTKTSGDRAPRRASPTALRVLGPIPRASLAPGRHIVSLVPPQSLPRVRAGWMDGRARCGVARRARAPRCADASPDFWRRDGAGGREKTMHVAPSPPTTRPNHHRLRASLFCVATGSRPHEVRGGSTLSLCRTATCSGCLSRHGTTPALRLGDPPGCTRDVQLDDIHVPSSLG